MTCSKSRRAGPGRGLVTGFASQHLLWRTPSIENTFDRLLHCKCARVLRQNRCFYESVKPVRVTTVNRDRESISDGDLLWQVRIADIHSLLVKNPSSSYAGVARLRLESSSFTAFAE